MYTIKARFPHLIVSRALARQMASIASHAYGIDVPVIDNDTGEVVALFKDGKNILEEEDTIWG